MPTSSSEVALRALRGLSDASVQYAVLHAAHKLHEGGISDVDTAVATDPVEVVKTARSSWSALGLFPILIWPYDIGGTITAFLATEDGREGVQLDMLFDPSGVGKYGVRSGALVDSAVDGPVPVVNDSARLIYLWRKRLVKNHLQILQDLRDEASTASPDGLLKASTDLTGSTETAECLLGIRDEPGTRNASRHPTARAVRVVNRIAHPIGHWAHVGSDAIASELAGRFSGFLVLTQTGQVPSKIKQPWWYISSVWPTILRPGVYLSYGNQPVRTSAIGAGGSTADEAARQLIAAMSSRLPT